MDNQGIKEKFDGLLSTLGILPNTEEISKIVERTDSSFEAELPTDHHDEMTHHDESNEMTFIKRQVVNRLTVSETIRQKNLNKVLYKARKILSEDEEAPSDKNVSMDWMLKFMDLAGNINDEFMQIVLGKILATEVKAPGHTSLRSLIQVASMSKDEMELFINLSKFIISIDGEHLIMNDKEFNDRHGLLYASLLRLEDCGLVNANGTLSWNHTLYIAKPLLIMYGREALVVTGKNDRQKFSMQVFTMKETGKALLSLIERKHDSQYLKDVQDFLSQQHKDLNVAYIEKLDIPEGLS